MVYIADGPSDIPCFSTIQHFGGRTYAVYKARSEKEFQKAYDFQKLHRVEAFGEANYEGDSLTAMWITHAVQDIAETVVRDRTRMLGDELGQPRDMSSITRNQAWQSGKSRHSCQGRRMTVGIPGPRKAVAIVKLDSSVGQAVDTK
jgi:hypothetical protein